MSPTVPDYRQESGPLNLERALISAPISSAWATIHVRLSANYLARYRESKAPELKMAFMDCGPFCRFGFLTCPGGVIATGYCFPGSGKVVAE